VLSLAEAVTLYLVVLEILTFLIKTFLHYLATNRDSLLH
jgi:hypothetical protein